MQITGFSVDCLRCRTILVHMSIKIKTVVVGAYQVNCFLVWDNESSDGIIIDPGEQADLIVSNIDACGFTPKGILLTHGHFDHTAAVETLRAKYNIPLYAGKGEEELLTNASLNGSAMFGAEVSLAMPEHLLEDESPLTIGSLEFRVLATPGHSPGGVCFLHESEGVLFCGDTLFAQSIGRTDLPGGSMQVLMNSIEKKIMSLPDSVVCCPGHGPATTVGAERTSNPFINGSYFA